MTSPTVNKKGRLWWLTVLTLLLAAVTAVNGLVTPPATSTAALPTPANTETKIAPLQGVWLDYQEFGAMLCPSEAEYHKKVDGLIGNMRALSLNALFVHLRAHGDSYYPSGVFPWAKTVGQGKGLSYDPVPYLIRQAHKAGIAVHGWINPYRLSKGIVNSLDPASPAYPFRKDPTVVTEYKGTVYWVPSASQAQKCVLKGMRELLEKYPLDGIHIDDYFYPTNDPSFDADAYRNYCRQTGHPLPLSGWRCAQVNRLLLGAYQLTHRYPGRVFGVSPAADEEKCKTVMSADVAAWVQGGYVDYLCPQLYFGFSYPNPRFRYLTLLDRWRALAKNVPLYVGLAAYKLGTVDAGSEEWQTGADLLARQTAAAYLAGAEGVVFYRYKDLASSSPQNQRERASLQVVLVENSEY